MNCNIRPLAKMLPALLPGLVAAGLTVAPAQAQSPAQQLPAYGFRSPPSAQANRIYSVNSATGEMSACQFERPEGSLVGVTKCFAKDASAGPQKAGSYELISTLYSGETGVFRRQSRHRRDERVLCARHAEGRRRHRGQRGVHPAGEVRGRFVSPSFEARLCSHLRMTWLLIATSS